MPKAYSNPVRRVPIAGPAMSRPMVQMTRERTPATEETATQVWYGTCWINSGVLKVVMAAATDMQMPKRPVVLPNMDRAAEVATMAGRAVWETIQRLET